MIGKLGTLTTEMLYAVMPQDDYYRNEAERCRELAASAPDAETARRWLRLCDDYTILAEELAAHIAHRPPLLRPPTQQQSLQQHQSGAARR